MRTIFFLCITTFFLFSCTNDKRDNTKIPDEKKEDIVTEIEKVEIDSIDYKERDNETMRSMFKK